MDQAFYDETLDRVQILALHVVAVVGNMQSAKETSIEIDVG